jgi:hypothetical protein
MKHLSVVATILFVSVLFFACNKDKKTAPVAQSLECDGNSSTYNSNIKSIIDINCSSSGCHPSFTTYAGIKPYLTNGDFSEEVLINKTMPRGRSLSNNDLSKIKCWADAGFPER